MGPSTVTGFTSGLAFGGEDATAVSSATEEWSQGKTAKTVDTD